MDPFLRYAILSTCILLIGMIPFFVIRVYMFTVKSHFLLSRTALRMSLITNLLSFILFLSLLIYYTSIFGFFSLTFYTVMVLTFILVLLIYKRLAMNSSTVTYIVSFTRFHSQKHMMKGLSSNHLTHISSKSTYSFLTHIKYVSLTEEEINEVSDEIKNLSHIYVSFKSITAYLLFALYVAILSISFVSFIVFFNVLLS